VGGVGPGVVLAVACGLGLEIVNIVLLAREGQTLGKKIVGVRVVRQADGGGAGFVGTWLLRAFVPGLLAAIPLLGDPFMLVNVLFIFGEERRCLHDLIAGTKVVRA